MAQPRILTLSLCGLLVALGCTEPMLGTDAGPRLDGPLADGESPRMDGGSTDPGDAGRLECIPEHRVFEPIELSFAGPMASETGIAPNPFLDVRLVLTLTSPSGVVRHVPGFFDGDGMGGADGDVYRVRFHGDEPGEWRWTLSFVEGSEVAINEDPGTPLPADGDAGTVCIGFPDPSAPGLRAHGRIEYVGEHYLQFTDGTWWIKTGADSPENFLGYAGFDGAEDLPGGLDTTGLDNGLHEYAPHIADWRDGDPDWGAGRGRGIIGALNYLSSEGVNSIYFLPCNLGGDGRDTHPYTAPDDLLHFDVSRLAQWELVFDHAERMGIAIHVVLSETEVDNTNLHDGGSLGPQRRLFYRELVARFGHHLGVFWNLGEESRYGAMRHRAFSAYLRSLDPWAHPLTVHTQLDRPAEQYDPLYGDENFELASIQLSPARSGELVESVRAGSAAAGRPWAVMVDEIGPAGVGVTGTNAPEIRRRVLWPSLFSGAAGLEWYFGYAPLPLGGDVRVEDFRTREEMWRYTRIAREFMESELPFARMRPADGLLSGATGDVFALEGSVYAVYLPGGAAGAMLDLQGYAGDATVRYFDPRLGSFSSETTTLTAGVRVALSSPAISGTEDWVVLVTGTLTPVMASCDYRAEGGIVVIEAEDLPFAGSWTEGSSPEASGGAYIEWRGSASPSSPGTNRIAVDIEITEPGTYRLQMRSRVGSGTSSTDFNDTWMSFPDASEFYGSQGASPSERRVYPRPLCTDTAFLARVAALPGVSEARCPAGSSGDGFFKVYSSGALNWRWSASTSDSDAHVILARFDAPGVYRLEISPRSDYHQLDRLVLHRVALSDAVVQDLSLASTSCP